MEVFTTSFFTLTPSLKTLTKKTNLKLHKTHLIPFIIPPFSPIINPKKTPIISRFNRPVKRRNSLRKKITEVSKKDPKFNYPVYNFSDNHVNEVNLDLDSGENGNFDSGNSKKLGESVLWNKLENWVDLYKKDIEFWGIGSNPIFTVFYDASNGRVDKVFVDEDEILRRNGVDLKYFREMLELKEFEEFNSEFREVNCKISHARFLAREMESGRDVIDRGSSVAKFVVSGVRGGLVSRARSVIDRGSSVAKFVVFDERGGLVSRVRSVCVSTSVVGKGSRIGIGVVLIVWMVKKLLGFGGEEREMSGVEKEMLRRKMKARVREEEVEKGSVEIVEDVSELELSDVIKRPRFDKEAVLDGIRKVKGLSGDSTETGFKVKEIQMMAKCAREIEAKSLDDGDLSKPKDKSSEVVDSNGFDDLETQSSVVLPVIEEYAAEEHVKGYVIENLSEDRAINGVSKTKFSESRGGRKSDGKFPGEEASEGVLSDVSSSNISLPVRRMPKIIRSVKEAREYLSLKNGKNAQVGIVSAIAAATNGRIGSYVGQTLGKDDKGLESSDDTGGILDRDPNVNVGEYKAVEKMKDNINILDIEPQVETTPLNLEMDKDSSLYTERNLGRTRDVDEMMKHSAKSEAVCGETTTHDTTPVVKDSFSSSEWLNKVDVEAPKPTDLSEKSDIVPDIISSYDVGNSRGVSDTHDERVLHHEKVHILNAESFAEVDVLDKTSKPTTISEIPVSIHAGDDLDGSSPKESAFIPTKTNDHGNFDNSFVESTLSSADTSLGPESCIANREGKPSADKESWLEKNFHEMEPIVNKMGAGFRDSYMVAREKVKQDVGTTLDFMELSSSLNNDTELEWMKDDKLREIVFKVRDNELAGRDPFHTMDLDDKNAFFNGLESKVEKESQKLATLHQWLHSNIENLDYGADGISIYDPPEKYIPRWKGPPIDEFLEFITDSGDQQQKASSLQKGTQSTEHNDTGTSKVASIKKPRPVKNGTKFPKTVIESSDGSIKPGKKSGKEYWQHTKKRTRGFLEVYNAETDPEVKAIMRDMGKDLDRWITEKEIQEAADLIDKFPQRGREFIEKKMSRIRREMELFGAQAVVSKYREYSDEKEEDYLWWIDLPHVLCIEMYIVEGEDQEVGFYTLEMAADLKLEPQPQHLIAFQDPGDCKNFCYILQAHLEMLNKGNAFVVPQHPKNVYQQAKASGFGVTVIRKGEVKLNIDQPLEEVEELISEIGSKIYHDAIMKERSIDVSSVIRGAFGINMPTRRRKKRESKRPSKP